jgi:TetR/AcrR family transcriptional regulator, ethionamide resistance regulator
MAALPPARPGTEAPTVSRRARRMREAPRRAGDVNEAALLDAARDLVLSGEFHDTPIGQIAQRAGISRQGFYFYFKSKEELLAQLVTETLYAGQHWRETLYDHDASDPPGVIRAMVSGTVAMWQRSPEILRGAVELGPRAPAVWSHWHAAVEETAEFHSALIVASTKHAELRDPDAARQMMVSLIWTLERNCYMHVSMPGVETDETLGARLSDILTRALGLE